MNSPAHDRSRWDTIYSQRQEAIYPEPDPLLLLYTPPVMLDEQPRALDLAGGLGQNALWLAEQGYTVDLMDLSRVALMRAREEMIARDLRRVNVFQVDLEQVRLQPETYDLICVFRFLSASVMPQVRAAVKPGGRVIYETFNTGRLKHGPHMNREYLLREGDLLGYFGDWRIVHHAEMSTVSQVVAIKS
ncbi:MAG: class I SAM-dependent methyltransferase [Anaerolineae bacterium]|nr:class I SAM-dependent methyltransferase [Anaerolineae bacterium]